MEEALPGSKQYSAGLLIFRLRLDKTHLGALRRDDDRFGVGSIVFLSFYEGPHILRRDQFHLMAKLDHLPGPVTCATARLHHDHTGRLDRHEFPKLGPSQLLAKLQMP